jgi:hypothetical protein
MSWFGKTYIPIWKTYYPIWQTYILIWKTKIPIWKTYIPIWKTYFTKLKLRGFYFLSRLCVFLSEQVVSRCLKSWSYRDISFSYYKVKSQCNIPRLTCWNQGLTCLTWSHLMALKKLKLDFNKTQKCKIPLPLSSLHSQITFHTQIIAQSECVCVYKEGRLDDNVQPVVSNKQRGEVRRGRIRSL